MVRGLVSLAILGATALSFNLVTAASSGAALDGFIDLTTANIQYDGTGMFGWAYGSTSAVNTCPDTVNDKTTPGVKGLFNCGSSDGSFNPNAPTPTAGAIADTGNGTDQIIPGSQTFTADPANTETSQGCASGGDQTSYKSGQKLGSGNGAGEPGSPPNVFQLSQGATTPAKNDLTNVYTVATVTAAGDKELYFGMERTKADGDVAVDLDFSAIGASLSGTCKNGILTTTHSQGDFALEFDFGGSSFSPTLYTWDCPTSVPTGTVCNNGGYDGGQVLPSSIATLIFNSSDIPCGGWVCSDTGGATTTVPAKAFEEGGIDLTAAGVGATCASGFMAESHTSASQTSDLSDLVGPGPFATCPSAPTTTTPQQQSGATNVVGGTWNDKAVVQGDSTGGAPTGTVDFWVCNPTVVAADSNGTCSKTDSGAEELPPPNPVSLAVQTGDPADASQAISPTITANQVGKWCFAGYYSGELGVYQGSVDNRSTECFTTIKATPALATTVKNASGTAIVNPVALGTVVHDTATLTGGFTPGGTVTYQFKKNVTDTTGCSDGTQVSTQDVTIQSGGTVPDSNPTAALGAGQYAFHVTYQGDGNNNSVSVCEPVDVSQSQITVQTVVKDVATNNNWVGEIPAPQVGAEAYDTTTMNGFVTGIPITGNVSYLLFGPNSTPGCIGTPVNFDTKPVNADGTVPNSKNTAPLAAGFYGFEAQYTDDANYLTSPVGDCEPFSVAKTPVTITTTLGSFGTSVGATPSDTSTITNQSPSFAATGTVTYTLYSGGTCSGGVIGTPGTVVGTDTVTLNSNGTVPNSKSFPAQGAGNYYFVATYNPGSDTNYTVSGPSSCEPFILNKVALTPATVLGEFGSSVGATPSDTASVGPQVSGFPATGTVTYTLYKGGSCSGGVVGTAGTVVDTDTVTLNSNGTVPNSKSFLAQGAGSYYFVATYNPGADTNYTAAGPSACEPFSINKVALTPATTLNPNNGTTVGATPSDSATVGPQVSGFPATGTVTYTLYMGGSCVSGVVGTAGTVVDTDTVTLNGDGSVPNSKAFGPLGAGSYYFVATYNPNGDPNYTAAGASTCEPFSLSPVTPSVSTTVFNAGTNEPWSTSAGSVGAEAYDTTTISQTVNHFIPSGTVTYAFYTDTGTETGCNGTPTTQTVTLNLDGTVPNSATTVPLAAGHYGYIATYNGDTNYNKAVGLCEPFTVGATPLTLATTLGSFGGTVGAMPSDTATLTTQFPTIPATGSVTYTLYKGGSCSGGVVGTAGTVVDTDTVTLNSNGTVPNSKSFMAQGAGSYYFVATYNPNGDPNYSSAGPSGCEPFSIAKDALTPATVLGEFGTSVGAMPSDTATVGPQVSGFPATGTVTYTLYSGGSCVSGVVGTAGTVVDTDTVTLNSNGTVPNSKSFLAQGAGSYYFVATYDPGADTNYTSSGASTCEPFSLNKVALTPATVLGEFGSSVGATPSDTASVGPQVSGFPATGTVTYTLYKGGSCSGGVVGTAGTVVDTDTVTLNSNGTVPNSKSFLAQGAGSYYFVATYNPGSDTNYTAAGPSACEPFSINKVALTPATVLGEFGTSVGAMPSDTATVSPQVSGFPATGTVTYTLYMGGSCVSGVVDTAGTVVDTSTVTLNADGTVPNSKAFGPIGAGSYYFVATYNPGSDPNYTSSGASTCEPFTLSPVTPSVSTTVFNAGTNEPWSTSPGEAGSSAYDTTTISQTVDGFLPSGTVTYAFYTDTGTETGCNGTPTTQTVDLNQDGTVPNSATTAALAAGNYGYIATYNGDTNYNSAVGACEPFLVTTPDFKVVKTDGPGDGNPVQPGSTILYTLTISDIGNGPGTVTVTDTLPSNLTIVSPPPVCSVSGCVVTNTTGTTWTFTMALAADGQSGDSGTVTFSAQVAASDTADVVNTATITSGRCDNGQTPSIQPHAAVNNCSSTVTNPVPDFTVTKTDGPGNGTSVTAGTTIPYTVAIKNVGDGGGTATITDTLPSNLTISGTPTCATTGSDSCKVTNTTGSTWTFDVSLAAGDTATVTFSAAVAAGATGTVTNTATITTGPCNTASGCSSTVSNPIPPVTSIATTPPPAPKPAVIAFTGADIAGMAAGGLALVGLGGFLVLLSRRRRQAGESA